MFVVIQIYTISSVVFFFFATIFYLSLHFSEEPFKRHGIINLHFDTQMYNPETALNGAPFNYTKLDICVSSVEPLFAQHKDMFTFDSIDLPGQKNVSVASSVEQCLTDPDIKAMICNCPIYTIYVKSSER